MVTSFQLLPPSCVTARPFQTQYVLLSGSSSLEPMTTLLGSLGLTARAISALGPGVWLPRATQSCTHAGSCARSSAPSEQSRRHEPSDAAEVGATLAPGVAQPDATRNSRTRASLRMAPQEGWALKKLRAPLCSGRAVRGPRR